MHIPGYKDLVLIHEGASALIHGAHREPDETPVILKVFNKDNPTPLELERFKHEFEILSALQTSPSALGVNARVLIDFVPEFGTILGARPPVEALSSTEQQNPFLGVIRRFVGPRELSSLPPGSLPSTL